MQNRHLMAAILVVGLGCEQAPAEPFIPDDGAVVLERLPGDLGSTVAALRRLRGSDSAGDLAAALAVSRGYFTEGQRSQDPRLMGYAQAALAPWWDVPDPPVDVLVMRAAIHQNRHRFAEAMGDLDRALDRDPRNPQAWVARATIELVQGRPESSMASCGALDRSGAAIPATICRAAVLARTGAAAAALPLLTLTLERSSQLPAPIELWAQNEVAEIARIAGDNATAERALRRALTIEPRDAFTLCGLADLLLDEDRAAEALALVEDEPAHDGKLLRATIAGRRLGLAWWRERAGTLGERFEAATRRGDALHLREEARYRLLLAGDPNGALQLAVANWREQREPWDARLLLESALAAGHPRAAGEVLDWLRATGLDDARLRPLLARLEAQG